MLVSHQNRGCEMSERKFKPDLQIWFDVHEGKFSIDKKIHENKTFCVENRLMNIWKENEQCGFFNKHTGTANDWYWGYAYNLMFEVIDFDWDSDVWLCRVLGYRE